MVFNRVTTTSNCKYNKSCQNLLFNETKMAHFNIDSFSWKKRRKKLNTSMID